MPDIDPLNPPTDLSDTNIITWVLGILLTGIIALWRRTESQALAAVNLLNTRLTKAEEDAKISDKKHEECEVHRQELKTQVALNTLQISTLTDKLNLIDKKVI